MREYDAPSQPLDDELADLATEVFRMLADGTRIRLLWALVDGELPVSALANRIGKPQPTVSQHLAKLRLARLVRSRRDGAQVFYSLENEHVERLVVNAVHYAEHAQPGIPRHHQAEAAGSVTTLDGRLA